MILLCQLYIECWKTWIQPLPHCALDSFNKPYFFYIFYVPHSPVCLYLSYYFFSIRFFTLHISWWAKSNFSTPLSPGPAIVCLLAYRKFILRTYLYTYILYILVTLSHKQRRIVSCAVKRDGCSLYRHHHQSIRNESHSGPLVFIIVIIINAISYRSISTPSSDNIYIFFFFHVASEIYTVFFR